MWLNLELCLIVLRKDLLQRASESSQKHPAAKKCCGWENPVICQMGDFTFIWGCKHLDFRANKNFANIFKISQDLGFNLKFRDVLKIFANILFALKF